MPKNKKQKTKHHGSNHRGELSQAEIWDDSALIRSWNDAVAEYEYYHSIHARGEDVEEVLRQAEMEESNEAAGTNGTGGEWRDVNDVGAVIERAVAAPGNVVDGDDNAHEEAEDGEIEEAPIIAEETSEAAEVREAARAQCHKLLEGASEIPKSTRPPIPSQEQDSALQPKQLSENVPSSVSDHRRTGPNLPPNTHAEAMTAPDVAVAPTQDQALENIKMAYYWAGYYSGLYDGQRQAHAQAQAQGQTQGPSGS